MDIREGLIVELEKELGDGVSREEIVKTVDQYQIGRAHV